MVQNNLGHSILGLYGVFCSIGNSNYQAYNASLIWSRKSNAKGLVTPSGEESPGIMIKIWNIFKYSFILIVPFYQFHTFIIVLSFIIKLLQAKSLYISCTLENLQYSKTQLKMFLSLLKFIIDFLKQFSTFFSTSFMQLFIVDATIFLKEI